MIEMSEQPRPVRAWCEYDEWSTFSSAFEGNGDFVVTPKGATGEAAAGTTVSFETAWKGRYIDAPLRTLRVLLSTGHEVLCDQRAMVSTYGVLYPQMFSWELRRAGHVWFDAPHGSWKSEGCSDSESVARAIAEAVAWVSEQEGGPA